MPAAPGPVRQVLGLGWGAVIAPLRLAEVGNATGLGGQEAPASAGGGRVEPNTGSGRPAGGALQTELHHGTGGGESPRAKARSKDLRLWARRSRLRSPR